MYYMLHCLFNTRLGRITVSTYVVVASILLLTVQPYSQVGTVEKELPLPSSAKVSNSVATKTAEKEIADYRYKKKSNYRVAIYTATGIIGAIALAGFIISGGIATECKRC
jgi:hypothetical protein